MSIARDLHVLTVDAGNTTTRLGMFKITPNETPVLVDACELTTKTPLTADEARVELGHALGLLPQATIDGAILSCVVPTLSAAWRNALERVLGCRVLVVGPGLKSGIKLAFDNPAEVGSDRIADAVATRARYGAPAIVIDLGTTTNFEVIDQAGAFAGGIIAPGISLSARALAQAAARLPLVELTAPERVTGRNTADAMRSGVVRGSAAMIDGLIDAIATEQHISTDSSSDAADADAPRAPHAALVITGEGAHALAALLHHEVIVDEQLTLTGLALIWQANQRSRA